MVEGDRPSSWATLRESLEGTQADLTAIPIGRAVVLLAVPTVLEMSMESLLTIVDIFFVSRLGSRAVATVGLTEALLSIVYALAMGLSSGASAIVARRTGEQDPEGAAVATVQAIGAAIVAATLIGGLGVVFAPRLLAFVGAEPAIVAYGSGYARIMLGGNVAIFLLFVVNAAFRSAGASAIAMRSLWLANALNMLLAPCFIFGLGPIPRMGVVGAAIATTISRAVGVVYQVMVLAGGRARLAIAARQVALNVAVMRDLLRIAWTGTLQVLVETASWLGLMRILSAFGSAALAGYTIAMRVAIFALLPSFGLASAAATLVGQNLGAHEPERAAHAVSTVARYNVAFLGLVGLGLVGTARPLSGIFTHDPAVADHATVCLRIVALGFLFFGYGMVIVQSFNGAGDTATPTFLNLACFWLFKIPLAYALAHTFGFGPRGVFIAIAAAYSAQAVFGGLLFRRGTWKTRQISSA